MFRLGMGRHFVVSNIRGQCSMMRHFSCCWNMARAQALILALVALIAISATSAEADWWEDASLYQIYPRSFKDSDADGVGDLRGITSRLEYLKEIGIKATWLSPVFESPMSDFGYDISNFTKIDPIFGNMEDFDLLIEKAKRIGVKIILDFVPNHSSDECEWFQKSIRREEGYEDFYVWGDGVGDPANSSNLLPPSNWVSVFGGKAWTWNEQRQQFYYHQFLSKQPDFNFNNANVHSHMLEVLKFWLDRGVDGFRIDAVPHIYEKTNDDGTFPNEPLSGWTDDSNSYNYLNHIYTREQYPTVELIYEWRAFLDKYKAEHGGDTRILLTEAYSPIEELDKYCGNGTHLGAHIPFNFNMLELNGDSTAYDVQNAVKRWMDTMWTKHQTANWVIGNHDKPRVSERFGRHKIDLINMIIAALPGTSVTYYGEEIGMVNVATKCTNISCDSRDPERTPFQWNGEANAGFSSGTSTWLPIADDYQRVNVQVERGVARSTLNIFKEMQKLRNSAAFRAFKEPGGWSYGAVSEQVFQIVRRAANNLEEYRILVNMGNNIEIVENLSNSNDAGGNIMEYFLMSLHSPHNFGDKANLSRLVMMPFEAVVLRWTASN